MRKQIRHKKSLSGQILLLTLFVMVVGLTIGVYVVSKTTRDVAITAQITDSSKAFNAAEAGIEEALKDISNADSTPKPLASAVSYQVLPPQPYAGDPGPTSYNFSNDQDGDNVVYIYPSTKQPPTKLGEAFTFWMSKHDANGNLIINNEADSYQDKHIFVCFTDEPTVTDPPALMTTIYFYETTSGIAPFNVIKNISRGFDPYEIRANTGINGNPPNNFRTGSVFTDQNDDRCQNVWGYTYGLRIWLETTDNYARNLYDTGAPKTILLAFRIQPVYEETSIAVTIDRAISNVQQGDVISAIGSASDAVRKIQILRQYPSFIPFMDYAVYSTSETDDLTK